MEEIGKDLLQARKGNVVFQFAWENCAWWPQKRLEKLLGPEEYGGPVPNYFRGSLFHAQPKIQPLKSIFRFSRKRSKKLQTVVIRILELFLRAWRGIWVVEKGKKVFKSLETSPFHQNNESFIPAFLHERILKGKIPGRANNCC